MPLDERSRSCIHKSLAAEKAGQRLVVFDLVHVVEDMSPVLSDDNVLEGLVPEATTQAGRHGEWKYQIGWRTYSEMLFWTSSR